MIKQNKTIPLFGLLFVVFLFLLAGCTAEPTPLPPPSPSPATPEVTMVPSPETAQPEAQIVVQNLINPVGVEALPDGSLLIAEEGTGENDDSAGVTLVLPDGVAGRLISGLPSSRDAGDLSGVPFAKWRDGLLYTSHFNLGGLYTLPLDPGAGLSLPNEPFTSTDLELTMAPLNAVQLRNPFDMTFDDEGMPIVTDATDNGVATMTPDGRTRFFHRFDLLANPGDGKTMIEAVPTGIERVGDEYFVTLTSGCPYPETGGQLVAIDMERNQRPISTGLSMPIDIAQAPDGTLWLLEFARFKEGGSCFSGEDYLPQTGRLSRASLDGTIESVLTELNYPGAITFDSVGDLYLSEIFSGRVIKVSDPDNLMAETSLLDLLGEPPVTQAEPEPEFPVQFVDVATESGLDFEHGAFVTGDIAGDPVLMMGGGLCWLDYDNDGWLDLYLVNSYSLKEGWLDVYFDNSDAEEEGGVQDDDRLPTNQLYRNDHGRFEDVSETSGAGLALRGNGCVAADLNRDGLTDIYITADGPNKLLWNQGDGTFQEGAAAAGVAADEWNAAASIGDLNQDGWPDLFVSAYIDLENKVEKPVGAFPQDFYGLLDHLYLNNGDGTFREVTAEVGLDREERGLGSVMSDFDRDGDLDLYIANDGHPNRLYLNEPNGSDAGFVFRDISQSSGTNDSGSGMGVATGDYDNDGYFDLLVTNWDTELNALYRNEIGEADPLQFRYSTFKIGIAGLGNNLTGWGTAWIDVDHDTDQDLLVANGHVPITNPQEDAQLVRLYGNRLAEGHPDQFREWTQSAGFGEEQLGRLMARGSAAADFDNDGDIDVAVNQIGGPATLLENRSVHDNNWFGVSLPLLLPGATATLILPDGREFVREYLAGSSYLASEDPRFHFGTAEFSDNLSLKIRLADGREYLFDQLEANQYYVPAIDLDS